MQIQITQEENNLILTLRQLEKDNYAYLQQTIADMLESQPPDDETMRAIVLERLQKICG